MTRGQSLRWRERVFLKLCPSLAECEPSVRSDILRTVQHRLRGDLSFICWTAVFNAIVVLLAMLLAGHTPVPFSRHPIHMVINDGKYLLLFAMVLAAFVGVQGLVARWVCPARVRRYTGQALNEKGSLRVCEVCGYDLRMTGRSRCPECGHEHRPNTEGELV